MGFNKMESVIGRPLEGNRIQREKYKSLNYLNFKGKKFKVKTRNSKGENVQEMHDVSRR